MADILLIDDTKDLVDVLSQLLEIEGHSVRGATSVSAALSLLNSGYHPHLIVCDYKLPESNGIELLKQVRKTPALNDVLFVMGSGNSDYRAEALEAGANGFVSKPYTHKDLYPFLKRFS
ncbi:MAG: response regulator [Chloroflexota bacterium]|nr:response regulator [Chloroflexota bacterium]